MIRSPNVTERPLCYKCAEIEAEMLEDTRIPMDSLIPDGADRLEIARRLRADLARLAERSP